MWSWFMATIAVFPILADVVEVKTGTWSTAHWSIHIIRLNGWLRHSFTLLITLLTSTASAKIGKTAIGQQLCRPRIEYSCRVAPRRRVF